MRKMILAVAAILLITSASVQAQKTEKKETTTADAWRQALPESETANAPVIEMAESPDNIEVRETAAQVEKRILELEGRLMEAFKQRDSIALRQLLADDFVPAGANITEAQADKTRFIEWTLKNSDLKTYAVEKTKVRLFPASAIVTAYYKQRTTVAGAPVENNFVATDVWVKRAKQWHAVSHHVTQLPKP